MVANRKNQRKKGTGPKLPSLQYGFLFILIHYVWAGVCWRTKKMVDGYPQTARCVLSPCVGLMFCLNLWHSDIPKNFNILTTRLYIYWFWDLDNTKTSKPFWISKDFISGYLDIFSWTFSVAQSISIYNYFYIRFNKWDHSNSAFFYS